MGKKNKDKKKGKGAEKTATKTEKKLSNKLKKELQARGEEDIETILAQIENEEKKRTQVIETVVDPPSRRLNFTFIPHPDKEQLILFGGEFFNGQKTIVYNDLYFYNIPNNAWHILKAPAGPPPRCGHQMVATSAKNGQLWLFGGEFVSTTQSQFYHYRDLWVYHIAKKQWEKITSPNGPSARSGHRMVYVKKQLIVFGGFHDNLRDYKYFNDVYSFNTETYTWTKIEAAGTTPAARSACCMVPLSDGRVLTYGGYAKDKIKKDVDKGHVFTDSFILTPDKNDTTGLKWKWVQVKLGGIHFSPRCSMPITYTPNNLQAYCFGGVFDTEDDDEDLSGNFYNDFYMLDLEKLVWRDVKVTGKKDLKTKKDKNEETEVKDDKNEMEVEESVEPKTISDDGVFKVTIGPSTTAKTTTLCESIKSRTFQPSPRINAGVAIKHGILYLFGGMFEDGDKQITFNDFYSVDLKKLEEWKILIANDISSLEWIESESESSKSDNEDDEEDNGSEESTSDMETN